MDAWNAVPAPRIVQPVPSVSLRESAALPISSKPGLRARRPHPAAARNAAKLDARYSILDARWTPEPINRLRQRCRLKSKIQNRIILQSEIHNHKFSHSKFRIPNSEFKIICRQTTGPRLLSHSPFFDLHRTQPYLSPAAAYRANAQFFLPGADG